MPVANAHSSDSRKAIWAAISSGLAKRPSGVAICAIALKVAAKEGAASGIRVNAIAPGGVETPIWHSVPMFEDMVRETGSETGAFEAMGKLMGRWAKPEEIAAQIAFLLSDEAANITGTVLASDGGYSI